jgi:hypothetical protein
MKRLQSDAARGRSSDRIVPLGLLKPSGGSSDLDPAPRVADPRDIEWARRAMDALGGDRHDWLRPAWGCERPRSHG